MNACPQCPTRKTVTEGTTKADSSTWILVLNSASPDNYPIIIDGKEEVDKESYFEYKKQTFYISAT